MKLKVYLGARGLFKEYIKLIFEQTIYKSEQNDECIAFTIMFCITFFLSENNSVLIV